MTNDEIKELIVLVNESGIFELEVQNGDSRVRIRRSPGGSDQQVVLPAVMPLSVGAAQPQASISAQSFEAQAQQQLPPKPPEEDERNLLVKSLIVATYYDATSQGPRPFVKAGD